MEDSPPSIESLHAHVRQLEETMVLVNDALLSLAGILGRAIVDAGVTTRSELADAIEQKAGPADREGHNPLLLVFSRAVRMNFPGGTFDVVEGGKPREVDPA